MSGLGAAEEAQSAPVLPRLGLRFAITYVAIAAVLFSIYGFPFELFGAHQDWLAGYLEAYARMSGAVLSWFEPGVAVLGNRIDGRFSLQIIRNCDAVEVNILFASAVLAFPAPVARRLLALVGGLAILVAANVGRICALYFIGVHFPRWFARAHEEVLPLALIALTALLFVGWAKLAAFDPVRSAAPPNPTTAL